MRGGHEQCPKRRHFFTKKSHRFQFPSGPLRCDRRSGNRKGAVLLGMVVLIVVAAGGGRRDTFKISFSEIGNFRTLIHLYSHSLFLLSRKLSFREGVLSVSWKGGHFFTKSVKRALHSFASKCTHPAVQDGEGRGKVRSPECVRSAGHRYEGAIACSVPEKRKSR